MAVVALGSKSTPVHIIPSMAGNTGTRLLRCRPAGSMATFTGQIPMGAFERKVGLQVMIELPAVPADGIVAVGTGRTEPATVDVVVAMTVDAGVGQGREHQAVMTLLTAGGPMHSHQREADKIVLKPGHQGPLGRLMTVPTGGERIAMGVIRPMTALAGPGQLIGEAAPVTVTAHQRFMRAQQGIAGFRLVIEAHLPAFLAVTIGTQGTIAAEMCIVSGVAALAVGGEARVIGFRHMAVPAHQFAVRTDQGKSGFRLVIEAAVPGTGAVTVCAAISPGAAMCIIQPVTIDARSRKRVESHIGMAGQTGQRLVFSVQGKVRGVVVELSRLPAL